MLLLMFQEVLEKNLMYILLPPAYCVPTTNIDRREMDSLEVDSLEINSLEMNSLEMNTEINGGMNTPGINILL